MSGSRRAEHKGTGNGNIIRFKLNGRRAGESIPASLLASSRGAADSDADVFLPPGYLNPLGSFDISPAARSVVAGVSTGDQKFSALPDDLVVFELADGGTLISSASALRDSLELSNPEFLSPHNEVMIEEMRTASAAPGRALGPAVKGVISKVHFLRVADDGINRAVLERLAIAGGRSATEILMELIEERVAGNAGLRRWSEAPVGDIPSQPDEPHGPQGKPLRNGDSNHWLVFIHGTASNTAGSFGDLRLDPATWSTLEKCFGGHIYSFEHRTLSRSPIENAIELVKALPGNAKISLVSHSRGGLIADLLCLDSFNDLIEDYGANASPRPGGDLTWVVQQREQLAVLNTLLHAKKLDIRRYVRVASPANGTLLAAGNFDVFLSGLLTLIGAVPFFYGSPIYSAFKRIVIEIARNRTDAHLVPGIAAMLPDSPLAQFLRLARVRKGVEMAVVAGDVDAGNMLSRLAVMLTDFLLFDKEDNDLVVNTAAMLAGIASRARARVLYDRGSNVSHFRYFTNIHTREAMRDWLTEPDLSAKKLKKFLPLPSPASYVSPIGTASRSLHRANADRPLVVVIPGVLGSHLGTDQNSRVWLEAAEIQKNTLARLSLEENGIDALDLFEMSYGPLCKHLDATHRVACFPYDWRQSLETLGTRLGRFLREQMDQSKGPIRILAHGMGGLLVRACRHAHPGIIEALMEREGARFIMLGTPNHGTHAVVENLIGKGDAVRSIARMIPSSGGPQIDTVLNTFASFPGVLSLLPAPDFKDTFQGEIAGGKSYDFHRRDTWSELKNVLSDKYFGDKQSAVPGADLLMQALWLWSQDGKQTASLPTNDEGKTIYVFGVARNTTCGIREELLPIQGADAHKKRLRLVGTTRGDGLVTWKSGRSTGIGSYYFMPVQHGDLLATEEYFPALDELLATGSTTLLSQQAPTDRAADRVTPLRYDAAPPTILDEDALQRELMGGSLRNRVSARTRRRLAVQVKAMDVRFAARPIMVGHYEQDPIGGAEAVIDRELLNGDLGKRYGLGLYAGPRGSTTVVLRGAAENAKPRAHLTGAVVVGLGRLEDPLSAADLTEAVHTSALRYLLHIVDILGKDDREVQLASVLLGFNSSANIPVSASVEALVSGVMQANARLHEMTGLNIRISSLDIIELYIDTAISAVYALRDLADRLAGQAESQGMSLVVNPELINGEGMRHRLINDRYSSYWPRLVVTDADRDESTPAVASDTGGKAQTNKLRFMFIGPRARAEVVVQQRQPGLVEALVREQVDNEVWDKEFGRMLFQLMVPHDFKDAARQLDRIVLVVDSHTANLPWELMLGAQDSDALSEEDELPLALRAAMVRQLSSTRFRAQVVRTAARNALVIGNPSVSGYHTAFESDQATRDAGIKETSFLQGAVDEAHTVADTLEKLNYNAMRVIGEKADKVLAALYRIPWRILHISAHGVFNQKHTDGGYRSGVLLSDGLLITAAEIAAMEVVPELVFLNCCHLGQIDGGQNRNKLAGSIARELIDIGVRCVLVAGWAVNDQQARTFGESFYKEILIRRRAFGDAVQKARRATWDANKQGITWGAFQAYGDPGWMAEPVGEDQADTRERRDYVAIDEVLDELARTRVRLSHQRDAIDEVDTQTVNRLVDNMIKQRSPKSWLDLAPLHSALGTIRIELRDLEQAYIEFLAAIRREDQDGRVPIRDIEQLVKVEALLAEQLAEEAATMFQKEMHAGVGGVSVGVTNVFERAEKLIWTAVDRLNGLHQLSIDISGSNQNRATRDGLRSATILASETNWMRSALRGFVWKSMASLQARKLTCGMANGDHAKVRSAMLQYLVNAATAYGQAAGEPGSFHFSPALALTHLALESLTKPPNKSAHQGKRDESEALARHCSQHADQELAEKADIFSALIHPKAQLVEHMIIGNLGRELAGDVIIEEIAQAYAEATSKIALKPSQLDEITTEIEAISRFCRALSLDPKRKKTSRRGRRAEMARTSERLELLAHRLQPPRLLSPSDATESAADDTSAPPLDRHR